MILVEGISDQVAIETLAERLGHDLIGSGIEVDPIGGAHAVGRAAAQFRGRDDIRLIGLCDQAERQFFERALSSVFVCDADLEDELIQAVGQAAIESILEREGDLGAFRTLQKQAVWRDRPFDAQMHRWLGAGAHRKPRYARLFVLACPLDRLPEPLCALIEDVCEAD